MSIRLREIEGSWIAICAARSVEKPGDIYLDDGMHHALAVKFGLDFAEEGLMDAIDLDCQEASLMQREESNNPNRVEWDKMFGAERGAGTEGQVK